MAWKLTAQFSIGTRDQTKLTGIQEDVDSIRSVDSTMVINYEYVDEADTDKVWAVALETMRGLGIDLTEVTIEVTEIPD